MSSHDLPPADVRLRKTDILLSELKAHLQVTNTDRALQLVRNRDEALNRQKRLSVVLAIVALAAPILIGLRDSQWDSVWRVSAILIPVVAIAIWATARERTFQSRLNEAGPNFYDQWKRDLRIKIRSTVAGSICGAVLAIGQATMAIVGSFDIWVSFFLGAVSFFTACGVVRVLTVELNDLRTEYRIVEESCSD